MYYEEKVIDGILCHRSSPNAAWIPFSATALTAKLAKIQKDYYTLRSKTEEVKDDLTLATL